MMTINSIGDLLIHLQKLSSSEIDLESLQSRLLTTKKIYDIIFIYGQPEHGLKELTSKQDLGF